MDIKPLKTEADYEAALQQIDQLMDAELDTPEGDQLDVLVTLVEAYEAKHYPMAAPDPIAAVEAARTWAKPDDCVCVTGSLYLVGAVRDAFVA